MKPSKGALVGMAILVRTVLEHDRLPDLGTEDADLVFEGAAFLNTLVLFCEKLDTRALHSPTVLIERLLTAQWGEDLANAAVWVAQANEVVRAARLAEREAAAMLGEGPTRLSGDLS